MKSGVDEQRGEETEKERERIVEHMDVTVFNIITNKRFMCNNLLLYFACFT